MADCNECGKGLSLQDLALKSFVCNRNGDVAISVTPTTPVPPDSYLELIWNDIANCPFGLTVGDANGFFNLPILGTPFTSLSVVGNTTRLYGGSGITLNNAISARYDSSVLVEINDPDGCITSFDDYALDSCTGIVSYDLSDLQHAGDNSMRSWGVNTANFPALLTAGNSCFINWQSATTGNFPLLTSAGGNCFANWFALTIMNLSSVTHLGHDCFVNISGNTITLTIPAAMAGDPNVLYLQANNTVTLILV